MEAEDFGPPPSAAPFPMFVQHTQGIGEREMHLGSTRGQRKEPSIVDNTYIMPKKEAFNMSDEQRQHIDYTGQFHQWYSHDMTNRLSLRIPAYLEFLKVKPLRVFGRDFNRPRGDH